MVEPDFEWPLRSPTRSHPSARRVGDDGVGIGDDDMHIDGSSSVGGAADDPCEVDGSNSGRGGAGGACHVDVCDRDTVGDEPEGDGEEGGTDVAVTTAAEGQHTLSLDHKFPDGALETRRRSFSDSAKASGEWTPPRRIRSEIVSTGNEPSPRRSRSQTISMSSPRQSYAERSPSSSTSATDPPQKSFRKSKSSQLFAPRATRPNEKTPFVKYAETSQESVCRSAQDNARMAALWRAGCLLAVVLILGGWEQYLQHSSFSPLALALPHTAAHLRHLDGCLWSLDADELYRRAATSARPRNDGQCPPQLTCGAPEPKDNLTLSLDESWWPQRAWEQRYILMLGVPTCLATCCWVVGRLVVPFQLAACILGIGVVGREFVAHWWACALEPMPDVCAAVATVAAIAAAAKFTRASDGVSLLLMWWLCAACAAQYYAFRVCDRFQDKDKCPLPSVPFSGGWLLRSVAGRLQLDQAELITNKGLLLAVLGPHLPKLLSAVKPVVETGDTIKKWFQKKTGSDEATRAFRTNQFDGSSLNITINMLHPRSPDSNSSSAIPYKLSHLTLIEVRGAASSSVRICAHSLRVPR